MMDEEDEKLKKIKNVLQVIRINIREENLRFV